MPYACMPTAIYQAACDAFAVHYRDPGVFTWCNWHTMWQSAKSVTPNLILVQRIIVRWMKLIVSTWKKVRTAVIWMNQNGNFSNTITVIKVVATVTTQTTAMTIILMHTALFVIQGSQTLAPVTSAAQVPAVQASVLLHGYSVATFNATVQQQVCKWNPAFSSPNCIIATCSGDKLHCHCWVVVSRLK